MITDFPLVKNMNPTEAQRGEVLLVCLKSYLFELLFLIEKGTEALKVKWLGQDHPVSGRVSGRVQNHSCLTPQCDISYPILSQINLQVIYLKCNFFWNN